MPTQVKWNKTSIDYILFLQRKSWFVLAPLSKVAAYTPTSNFLAVPAVKTVAYPKITAGYLPPAPTAYAPPAYASPAYASPAYASPAYASPAYAPPAYAPPAYASPAYYKCEKSFFVSK